MKERFISKSLRYWIRSAPRKYDPMVAKERVMRTGNILLWSIHRLIDYGYWKTLIRERDEEIAERRKKEALPEKENIDLNFLFSTLKEMEKRNIKRHKEVAHTLTKENKTLKTQIAELEKRVEASEEMIKDIRNRVNGSLDDDLTVINKNVLDTIDLISRRTNELIEGENYIIKKIKEGEASINSKVGGVASSVYAKTRKYPI